MTMIRRTGTWLAMAILMVTWAGCGNKNVQQTTTEPRHATVFLQDGTKVSGNIQASSPSEITLVTDDGSSRTIPMDQVKSVAYGEGSSGKPKGLRRRESAAGSTAGSSGSAAPAPSAQSAPAAPAPPPTYQLPAGTQISVRTNQAIDSSQAAEGQTFDAQVTNDVTDSLGAVAIPSGSSAQLAIVSASKGGHFQGASDLSLTLASVTVGGQRYQISAGNWQQTGKAGLGKNKRTAEYAGGGAAIGAIIGAIAGHGKGAAIGAGSGAGAGALAQVLTRGSVKVPAETALTFTLSNPLQVTAR